MVKEYNIVAASNDTDFGKKAADVVTGAIVRAGERNPRVILPTGNTPLPLYEEFRKRAHKVPPFEYWQLDEYLGLPPEHPRRFFNEMRRNLLQPLNITTRFAFMSVSEDIARTLDMGAAADRKLTGIGYPDPNIGYPHIAVIGIGGNGHVGFNEPGTSFWQGPHVVQLSQKTIEDNSKGWDTNKLGAFPTAAITLGIRDLHMAQHTVLLVRGAGKAEILAKALYGEKTPDVPASYLQDQRNVTIVADEAALSALPQLVIS